LERDEVSISITEEIETEASHYQWLREHMIEDNKMICRPALESMYHIGTANDANDETVQSEVRRKS